MALVVWPVSLPQDPFIGYVLEDAPNTITSDNSAGPPKVRRRSTYKRRFMRSEIEITGAQLETFDTFMGNIKDGADAFQWVDPRDGATTAAFMFIRPVSWLNVTPATDPALRRFTGILELEKVPV